MWKSLLALLVGEDTGGLMISLHNGGEIAVQQIVQVTETYMVARGRWAGSSESGWTFVVPWDQIVCCVFSRALPEKLEHPLGLVTSGSKVSAEQCVRPVESLETPASSPTLNKEVSAPPSSSTFAAPVTEERLKQLRERLRQRLQE